MEVFEENHPKHARILNNLGDSYMKLGLFHKAVECYEKSKNILR